LSNQNLASLAQSVLELANSQCILKMDARGDSVDTLQAALLAVGFNPQGIDGVFGPKTQAAVLGFQKAYSIGLTCEAGPETLAKLAAVLRASTPNSASVNQRLYDFYSTPEGYAAVQAKVAEWFAPQNGGSSTHNGCAAFLSTALNISGYDVPYTMMAQILADELIAKKWQKVAVKDLLPGDVIVTQDNPEYPGYAAHIFMTAGWADQSQLYCYAVDNQQTVHYARNLGPGPKTPMAYALRAS
jgi:hypothetical protein